MEKGRSSSPASPDSPINDQQISREGRDFNTIWERWQQEQRPVAEQYLSNCDARRRLVAYQRHTVELHEARIEGSAL